ncbi:MAG: hypothetical protein NZT61_06730 [Deltaproteobacteria bacterium]|nr:hypothetical protein [Deltaproteobacteria bacterium]
MSSRLSKAEAGLFRQIGDKMNCYRWFSNLTPDLQKSVIKAVASMVIGFEQYEVSTLDNLPADLQQRLRDGRIDCVVRYCTEILSMKLHSASSRTPSAEEIINLTVLLQEPDVVLKVLENGLRWAYKARAIHPEGDVLQTIIDKLTESQTRRSIELLRAIEARLVIEFKEQLIDYLRTCFMERNFGFLHVTYEVFSKIVLDHYSQRDTAFDYDVLLGHVENILHSNEPKISDYLEEIINTEFQAAKSWNSQALQRIRRDLARRAGRSGTKRQTNQRLFP